MEARTTCFISFIKLLFSLLTKRKTIYEVHTVNSHKSETVKQHGSHHFRASYENTLVDQSKCAYYPNYFIIFLKSNFSVRRLSERFFLSF